MRHLVAAVHREMLTALVPYGAAAARLDRLRGPALPELASTITVRLRRRASTSPVEKRCTETGSRHARRPWDAPGASACLQFAPRAAPRTRPHQLGGVLGEVAVCGDHARHWVAMKRTLSIGSVVISPAGGRRSAAPSSAASSTARGPGRCRPPRLPAHSGCLRVDATDARMRMRRAHEAGVQRAGEHDVLDVAPVSGEEAPVLLARERRADVAQLWSLARCAEDRASTMLW